MLELLKKSWLWLLVALTPSLAFAAGSIHVSGFLAPLLTIIVIVILALIFLWAIGYWAGEMSSVFPLLPKILKFIVCVIAIIWIVLILAGLFGVHIT
jgi:hypothetical protein